MYKNVYLVGMTVFLAIFAMVVTFSTCEAGGRVPVDRCAGNHAPLYDDGFLWSLFWTVAEESGLSSSLD